ncbi:MAG: hypothetical protein ACI9HK_000973 [Pirellulaceae bacterium]
MNHTNHKTSLTYPKRFKRATIAADKYSQQCD